MTVSNDVVGKAVTIVSVESSPTAREIELSSALNLPLMTAAERHDPAVRCYLQFDPEGLSLYSNEANAPGAVRVDFSNAGLNYRVTDSVKQQNIVKAIGLKAKTRPRILDATAGLGKDAYLLASQGCDITLLERSKIVHALLADGIDRALVSNSIAAKAVKHMHLLNADFKEVAMDFSNIDVVYLDPMFPLKNKSARAKKDMYLLQHLLGNLQDDPAMLNIALQLAGRRVVVKRAKNSAHLGDRKPDIEFRGSSSRYDVYLTS